MCRNRNVSAGILYLHTYLPSSDKTNQHYVVLTQRPLSTAYKNWYYTVSMDHVCVCVGGGGGGLSTHMLVI